MAPNVNKFDSHVSVDWFSPSVDARNEIKKRKKEKLMVLKIIYPIHKITIHKKKKKKKKKFSSKNLYIKIPTKNPTKNISPYNNSHNNNNFTNIYMKILSQRSNKRFLFYKNQ